MGTSFLHNCRLCASKTEESQGVFIFRADGAELGIEAKIRRYLRLEIRENDDLPQKLCTKCSITLTTFHKFAEDCLRIQNRLMNLRVSLRMKSLSEHDLDNTADIANIVSPEQIENNVSADSEHIEIQVEVDAYVNQSSTEPVEVKEEEPLDNQNIKRRSRKQSRPLRTPLEEEDEDDLPLVPPKKPRNSTTPRGKGGRPARARAPSSKLKSTNRGRGRGRGRGRVPAIKLKLKPIPTPPESSDNEASEYSEPDQPPSSDSSSDESDNSKSDETDPEEQEDENLASFYRLQCQVCEELAENWKVLVTHCKTEHGERPAVKCYCGKAMSRSSQLTKHQQKHISSNKFKCAKCNKSFTDKTLLEAHINTHIPKSQRPFQCSQCNKKFHTDVLVRQHEKTHVPVEMRAIWQCDICNKKLCTKNSLETHQKNIHMGERSYVCDICGRTFTQKGILKDHLVTHSDETPYACDKCGKSFKTKPRLKIHSEVHREDPLVCPVCGMQLNTSRTLRIHMATHSNDRPYACMYCGKGFKRSKDLKGHYNYHEGKKPYQCRYCGRCFANTGNCRSHKRRMHAEELRKDGKPATTKKGTPINVENNIVEENKRDNEEMDDSMMYRNHQAAKMLNPELAHHQSVLAEHVATTSALMNVALFPPPHFGSSAYHHA